MIQTLPRIAAVILLTGCQASAPHSDRPRAPEQEIRALLNRWERAFEKRDLHGVMSIYDGNLLEYDFGPAAERHGADALQQVYARFFARFKGPLHSELRDLHVVAGPTVAFSYALQRVTGTSTDGSRFDMWLRFTQGYRRVNGRWLVVHEHVSVPIDLKTGRARLDFTP